MTDTAKTAALKSIEKSVEINKARIEKAISDSGLDIRVDPSVLFFVAKNYNTIKKLEKE